MRRSGLVMFDMEVRPAAGRVGEKSEIYRRFMIHWMALIVAVLFFAKRHVFGRHRVIYR